MSGRSFKIGVVASAGQMDPLIVSPVCDLAGKLYGRDVELRFHPACFGKHGHFSSDDATRAQAFLDYAQNDDIDSIWFGRGGYGSARIAATVLAGLGAHGLQKSYLGYSDVGVLLAGLYKFGGRRIAHGPMVQDLRRDNGEEAVERALRWLVEQSAETIEEGVCRASLSIAFNLTVLCHLIGTVWEPDLTDHVGLIEEVSEPLYRIDRGLCQLAHTKTFQKSAGLRLGRCSNIIPNEPDFVLSPEEIAQHWCSVAGIPYLGRADIGHDAQNKIVPFGRVNLDHFAANL